MRFERPDLHLLRVFLTVVECGSFRAAQSRLGCRASTVSMNIKKLETRLGFSLCQRGRGGLILTPAGETILEAARRFVDAVTEYNTSVARARERAFGELKLCLCDVLQSDGTFSLSAVLGAYVTAHPNVQLSVDILAPIEIERRVLDDGYDIGIVTSFHNFDGLVYEPLIPETQFLVCALGHPLFDRSPGWTLDELTGVTSLVREYLTPSSLRLIPFIGRIAARVNSIEASILLIRSGGYVGYLPEHVARPLIAAGSLRELTPDARYTVTVFVVYKKSHLWLEVRSLVGHIVGAGAKHTCRLGAYTKSH